MLPGGHLALTSHAGPYAAIFPRLLQLSGYQIIGLPVIEVYHTSMVNIDYGMNHTDIYIPVAPGR